MDSQDVRAGRVQNGDVNLLDSPAQFRGYAMASYKYGARTGFFGLVDVGDALFS